jgi:hypothetical protein
MVQLVRARHTRRLASQTACIPARWVRVPCYNLSTCLAPVPTDLSSARQREPSSPDL